MREDTIERPPARVSPAAPLPARGGRRGRATRRLDPASPCLNCGDGTPGRYCPSCGQRKTDIHVSLRTLLVDSLEEELSVDRRFPATLGALFLEPGQLTVDYVNGRIARYIRPVRLYLVSSLIFFLVFSFLSIQFLRDRLTTLTEPVVAETVTLAEVDSALAAVREAMEGDLPGIGRAALRTTEAQLLRQRSELLDESTPPEPAEGTPAGDTMAFLDGFQPNLLHPALSAAAASKIRQLRRMEPREAAERVMADFFRYAPTVMFVLLPVFGLVLKALYVRRRRFYAEHFIFLLHTQSFVFLQFTVLLLLVAVGWTPGWLVLGIVGWMLIYTYLAMKRVYGQGWLKTLAKWWVLGWTYFWILLVTVPLAFFVTAILA
jgi:hypothetical protein